MVTGGLLAMVIGALIGAFATSAGLLLASRVIEGIGFATVAVAAPKIIFDETETWHGHLEQLRAHGYGARHRWQRPCCWIPWVARYLADRRRGGPVLHPAVGFGTSPRRWPDQPRADPKVPLDGRAARIPGPSPCSGSTQGAFMLYSVTWFAVAAWLPTFLVETQGRSAMAAGLFSRWSWP